jgi:hypothetical protein
VIDKQGQSLADHEVIRVFDRSRLYSTLFLCLSGALGLFFIPLQSNYLLSGQLSFNIMALFLFLKQDVLILPIFLIGLMLKPRLKPYPNRVMDHQTFYLASVVSLIFCICWLGHHAVFLDYDLSRDEQLANFDADIFAKLRLFAPIPLEWRQIADALNQTYILPIGNHEDWVSFYLPINAIFRAIFGTFLSRSLTSPLLVVLGAFALWRVSGQLFPAASFARWVALALYAGSSQIIITGMTSYAMTGHLALNLIWLTLFLERKPSFDAAAIFVGFLATGLHQPIFHPLFVIPFLFILKREDNWHRLVVYIIAYGAICAFWLVWPSWISSFGHAPVPLLANPNGIGPLERVAHMLSVPSERSVWLMCLNLIRFFVWQHLMLLPLLVFGAICNWKTEPIVRALTLGLLLTATAMFILQPYQGHGWGYRYLHGLIGSACLVATYGFQTLEIRGYSLMRPLLISTGISVFILLPAHALQARIMVSPFESANNKIDAEKTDVVIIDDTYVPFGQDLVLNRPDFLNRPIRLLGSRLGTKNIDDLCKSHSISFLDARDMNGIAALFSLSRDSLPSAHQLSLEKEASVVKCPTAQFLGPKEQRDHNG